MLGEVNDQNPARTGRHNEGASDPMHETPSRRSLLLGGGVAGVGLLGVGAVIGHETPRLRHPQTAPTPTATPQSTAGHQDATDKKTASKDPSPPMRSFVSTTLTTPVVSSWRHGASDNSLVFLTQWNDSYRGLIMDDAAEPVWIAPSDIPGANPKNMLGLDVQTYRGKPVLTYWSGTSTAGHGLGDGTILDTSYRRVATVQAGGDMKADMHEFKLTSAGTALLTAYPTVAADLRAIGGPKDGHIFDCHVQEVDVRTGRVLLDWSTLAHIGVDETYMGLKQGKDQDGTTPARAFDPFHLNSIDEDGDRLLISARHTHAVYAIDRTSGKLLWRFGGRRSDFTIPAEASFAWQHDARWRPGQQMTLFDDHYYATSSTGDPGAGHSRGLRFAIDESAKTAKLTAQYAFGQHKATAMGNMEVLANGNAFLGWGTVLAITEFDPQGNAVYEATLGGRSYRAFRRHWVGNPTTRPSIKARREGSNVGVHLSWNGATEVDRWRILAGAKSSELKEVATVPRTGFESSMRIAPADVIAAQAIDERGTVIGRTATVDL